MWHACKGTERAHQIKATCVLRACCTFNRVSAAKTGMAGRRMVYTLQQTDTPPHVLLLCVGVSYKRCKILEMLFKLIKLCEIMGAIDLRAKVQGHTGMQGMVYTLQQRQGQTCTQRMVLHAAAKARPDVCTLHGIYCCKDRAQGSSRRKDWHGADLSRRSHASGNASITASITACQPMWSGPPPARTR